MYLLLHNGSSRENGYNGVAIYPAFLLPILGSTTSRLARPGGVIQG